MLVTRPEVKSSLNHPVGAGVVVILLIAAAILLAGEAQVEGNVLSSVSQEQERDLIRFSETLHYSGVALDDRDSLKSAAATKTFDAAVRRALFGMRAERLDLYTLTGDPLYSTGSGLPPHLLAGGLLAFDEARRGGSVSVFTTGQTAVLQTFTLFRNIPPDVPGTGRSLMVAAISTDVSAEIKSANEVVWLVAGIFTVGSLLIIATVGWVSARTRARLEHTNRQLAARNIAVEDSRERMIAASDATKRAIAEELHGTVQTKLFALWMRLRQISSAMDSGKAPDAAELGEIVDGLDSLREHEIRGLSHRLHPSIVRVGALPALRSLVSNLGAAVHIELDVNEGAARLEAGGVSTLPEDLRLGAYRIAEMAIGNVIKHSGAGKCVVSWHYYPDSGRIVLKIEDDGAGFDVTSASSGGLGVVNINDYADSLDGTVELVSSPGEGTCLTVIFPFVPEANRPEIRVSPSRGARLQSPGAA